MIDPAWWIFPVSVLGSGLFFGLFPGLILRAVVQFYPPGHPRREELFGELYHSGMGRLERYEWVFQQFETAFREGPSLRKRARQEQQVDEQQADISSDEPNASEADSADNSTPPSGGSGFIDEQEELEAHLLGEGAKVGSGTTRPRLVGDPEQGKALLSGNSEGDGFARVPGSDHSYLDLRGNDPDGGRVYSENPKIYSENPRIRHTNYRLVPVNPDSPLAHGKE